MVYPFCFTSKRYFQVCLSFHLNKTSNWQNAIIRVLFPFNLSIYSFIIFSTAFHLIINELAFMIVGHILPVITTLAHQQVASVSQFIGCISNWRLEGNCWHVCVCVRACACACVRACVYVYGISFLQSYELLLAVAIMHSNRRCCYHALNLIALNLIDIGQVSYFLLCRGSVILSQCFDVVGMSRNYLIISFYLHSVEFPVVVAFACRLH